VKNRAIASLLIALGIMPMFPTQALAVTTTTSTAQVSSFDPTNFLTESGWIKVNETYAYLSSVDLNPTGSSLKLNGVDFPMINTGSGVYGTVVTAAPGTKIYVELRDVYVDWKGVTRGSQARFIYTMEDTQTQQKIYFNGGRSSGSNCYMYLVPVSMNNSQYTPNYQIANVQELLLNTKIDNTTSATQLQTLAQSAVDSSKYSVSVTQSNKISPTESTDGNFQGNIVLTDITSGEQATSAFNLVIPKLAQSLSTISTTLSNFINNYNATNSSKASDFINAVAITNSAYNVSVGNWNLTPATDIAEGNLSCNVYINESSTVRQTFTVNKKISKLPTTASTATSILQGIVNNYVATNSSDKTAFLNMLKTSVSNNITVTIPTWTLNSSTETLQGSLVGTIDITDGATTQTINLNRTIGYLDQSITTAQTNVQAAVDNLSASNYLTENEVLNIAKSTVNLNYFNVTVNNFSNINSTETDPGSVAATITIADKGNSSNTRTVTLNKVIPILSQTIDNAEAIVQNILSSYSVNNGTTQEEILNNINSSINNNYITASIESFNLAEATETSKGSLGIEVKLFDLNGNTRTVSKYYVIGVQEQSLDTIYSMLDNYSINYNANNGSKETDLTKAVVITNSDYSVDVDGWNLIPATDTIEGILGCNLNIRENGEVKKTIRINKTISKLATTTATAKEIVQGIVDNYIATNSSDKNSLLNTVKKAVGNNIIVSIPSWNPTFSTETTRGSLIGEIQISDGITGHTVDINKIIEVEKQSVETVKALFQKSLEDMRATNDTVANDILDNVLITNQNIKVKLNNFKITPSTETSSGLITGNINISDGITSEEVSVNLKISQLQQSVDTVQSLFQKRLESFVATNETIENDILDLVYVNNEDISISIDNFSILQATDTEKGAVSGTIKITDGTTTKEIEINKPIELLSQELSTSVRLVQNAINTYSVDNDSTFDNLLIQCNNAVTQNIDVYYKVNDQLKKVNSTEFEDGIMAGTMIVTDGNTMIELPFEITISKLPQTLQGAKTLITNTLKNFKPTNNTTAQNILNAVGTSLRNSDISVAFGSDEESFNKTSATEFIDGAIKGVINLSDGVDTIKVPVNISIEQLDQTIEQAEQSINTALPNCIVTNNTLADYIKQQIEDVAASNIYVTIKDFRKAEATLQDNGSIQATVILVDKNTGNSQEISLNLTINRLNQTSDEAKNTILLQLPNITVNNNTIPDTIKSEIESKVGGNISIDIQDLNKNLATINTEGNIVSTIIVTDNITGNITNIPMNLTIKKLEQSLDEAKNTVLLELPNINVNNDTTSDSIKEQLKGKIAGNITIDVQDINKKLATINEDGNIISTIIITDRNTGNISSIPVNLIIQKLQQSLDEAKYSLNTAFNNIIVSNDTIVDDLKNQLQNKVGENIQIEISDFNKSVATQTKPGEITGTITIINKTTGEQTQESINLTISKLPTNVVSGGGGARTSSSNTNKPLTLSSKIESVQALSHMLDRSNLSLLGISRNNLLSNVTINNIKTISSNDNIGFDEVKSVVSKVELPYTEIKATDGQPVKGQISMLVADSSIVGINIQGEEKYGKNASIKVITEVPEDNVHVYTNVKDINKYVDVTEKNTKTKDGIVLPGINSDNYLITSKPLLQSKKANTGWYKNENGEWLYINNYEVHKGWIYDNGWYYTDLVNGKMKTGWLNEGPTWYYLNEISDGTLGKMKTGWIKDKNKWYYLYSDGSMAKNTYIDGYYLDQTGAWVK
jgi:FOG: Glucan-binding domain (YG repeat)